MRKLILCVPIFLACSKSEQTLTLDNLNPPPLDFHDEDLSDKVQFNPDIFSATEERLITGATSLKRVAAFDEWGGVRDPKTDIVFDEGKETRLNFDGNTWHLHITASLDKDTAPCSMDMVYENTTKTDRGDNRISVKSHCDKSCTNSYIEHHADGSVLNDGYLMCNENALDKASTVAPATMELIQTAHGYDLISTFGNDDGVGNNLVYTESFEYDGGGK